MIIQMRLFPLRHIFRNALQDRKPSNDTTVNREQNAFLCKHFRNIFMVKLFITHFFFFPLQRVSLQAGNPRGWH